MAHDGVHPAGLQQLIEIGRKSRRGPGAAQLAIQRSANGGVHIEMTTVDRPAASAAIKACTACSSAKARRDSFRVTARWRPPNRRFRSLCRWRRARIAGNTKDDQQRLRERLPPLAQIVGCCSSSSIGAVSLPCTPAEGSSRRHGAVGSSCKCPRPASGPRCPPEGPRLQAAVQ